MYKRIMLILAFSLLFLTGCAESKGVAMEETPTVDATIELTAPTIELKDLLHHENLLTGTNDLTDEAIGKRPVAVMINNIPAALPQYGISAADVIFELPVEGNQTRLMALYADYTQVPKICAIRSCRYYYPAIAKGFDAYYVHWGMDETVRSYVNSLKMDRFDGMNNTGGLYGRDSARRSAGYSLEHTGYFDGTKIVNAINSLGMRTDLLDSKKEAAFNFCEYGAVITPTGDACNKAKINFGAQSSTLTYDAESNLYYKKHNNNAHKDGKTGEQLAFTNVFVLETSIGTKDSEGHKSINWQGSSSANGYYISNGVIQKIHWSQTNESSYLKFYTESGEELVINRGKSYIAYCSKGQTSFE